MNGVQGLRVRNKLNSTSIDGMYLYGDLELNCLWVGIKSDREIVDFIDNLSGYKWYDYRGFDNYLTLTEKDDFDCIKLNDRVRLLL